MVAREFTGWRSEYRVDVKFILRAGSGKARYGLRSDQALFQALQEDFAGKFDANEHHLADPLLVLAPGGPQVTAHQLMHALEDDLAFGSLHIQ